jgi:hypothetical protein
VITRPGPKLLGVLLVVRERHSGDLVQHVRFKLLAMHRGVSALDQFPIRIGTQLGVEWHEHFIEEIALGPDPKDRKVSQE